MGHDYSSLLGRIQAELNIVELSSDDIAHWLAGHDKRGKSNNRRRLATMLYQTMHQEDVIAESFTVGQQFAEERGIILTERTTAKVYEKWGRYAKQAIVLRTKGKIRAWRYL